MDLIECNKILNEIVYKKRTHCLVVSNMPACVLFPNVDLTSVVGYINVFGSYTRLKLSNLKGYYRDDSVYCSILKEHLLSGEQSDFLLDAFGVNVDFSNTYIYLYFLDCIERLIINYRLLSMLSNNKMEDNNVLYYAS